MQPPARWALIAVVATLLVAAPVAPSLLPATGSDLTAVELRRQIGDASGRAWSGEVTTRGGVQIPDTASFGSVVNLLGEDNTLRVWWGDATHWRVDDTRQTGEADLFRTVDTMTRWVFESSTATVTPYSSIRLPDVSDILPSRLASRMLAGSEPSELSRIGSRRVVGRSAAGLRLVPSSAASTIDHVDVWADDSTGLPLKVEVYGDGSTLPVITSTLTDLDLGRPSARTLRFAAPPGIKVRSRDTIDVAAGANAFAPFVLPDTLAGFGRRGGADDLGAVGVYGRGPTALLAIPLRRGLAAKVRTQLTDAATSRQTAAGTALKVGPLSVLLTDGRRQRGTFLIAGTVTPKTLQAAADQLDDQVRFR